MVTTHCLLYSNHCRDPNRDKTLDITGPTIPYPTAPESFIGVQTVSSVGTSYSFYCTLSWSTAIISESDLYFTKLQRRLPDVLPVQQIHQKWYKKFFLYWCQVHFFPWRWMLRRLRCVQSKRFFIKPPYSISTPSSIDSDFCRLPTASVLSNKADNYVPISFDQQAQVFLEAICQADIREIMYYYL